MTNEVLESARQEMDKTIQTFKKDLTHVRTGRASTQEEGPLTALQFPP